MSEVISQRELRNDSARIMRALDAGDSFLVTRNGALVGELRPLRRARFVSAETAVGLFRGLGAGDYAELRHDLDAAADQDPVPRG